MKSVVISSGHSAIVRGASAYLDEVDEARRIVNLVAEKLRARDVIVETFHDDTSTSQNQNLETIVRFHNSKSRQLDISVHLNCTRPKIRSWSASTRANPRWLPDERSDGHASRFIDRGPKKRSQIFIRP
jgi:N-acetylmuramoyl-L-alanine amidase